MLFLLKAEGTSLQLAVPPLQNFLFGQFLWWLQQIKSDFYLSTNAYFCKRFAGFVYNDLKWKTIDCKKIWISSYWLFFIFNFGQDSFECINQHFQHYHLTRDIVLPYGFDFIMFAKCFQKLSLSSRCFFWTCKNIWGYAWIFQVHIMEKIEFFVMILVLQNNSNIFCIKITTSKELFVDDNVREFHIQQSTWSRSLPPADIKEIKSQHNGIWLESSISNFT